MNQKTAVVTGASSGIGLAIVKEFLAEGYNVVGNARSKDQLKAVHQQLDFSPRFLPVDGDIGKAQTSKRIYTEATEKFGRVDVHVNNAGIFNAKPFVDYTAEDLESLLTTNLRGVFYASQEAAKHMIPLKSGHIINITASIADQPLIQVPAALPIMIKGGINHATKALALELAAYGIKVAAVAPGIVDTPLYSQDMHGFLKTLQPAGRLGTAEEIAHAVLYLASADFTTGVVLPVDGGMSAGRF